MMKKLTEFIKDNIPTILILLTILIVSLIIIFKPNSNNKNNTYDTSLFNNLTVKEALDLFNSEDSSILIIGRSTCSACISYLPTLQNVVKKYNAKINYLELEKLQNDKEETNEFKKHLDFEYTYDNQTQTFDKFIGTTPMLIIIKNHQMVYGYLGTTSEKALVSLLQSYDIIK